MPTAVISIRNMLDEVIRQDSEMQALLSADYVYAGKATAKATLNYIVLGQTTETPQGAGYYNRKGHQGTEEIHCWARTKWTAQKIFAQLSVLLDDQRPVVHGHVVMKGVLDYVTDVEGADGKSWQVWARYRVRSLVEL